MNNYKQRHEEFVSGLNGSSLIDLVKVILLEPLALFLYRTLRLTFRNEHSIIGSFVVEFLVLVLPLLFIVTKFEIISIFILILLAILCLYFSCFGEKYYVVKNYPLEDRRRSCISTFRGSMMLLTCICILAVDFQVFPRYFAKTESFGISLMDIGCGCFIVSSGLTSKASSVGSQRRWVLSWNKIMVLILGVLRLVVLRMINYHEHNSEYGVHWNFFVTLFCVWSLSSLLESIFPLWIVCLGALGGLLLYQFYLSSQDLSFYVLHHDRIGFFHANREGILSLFGALFLFAFPKYYSNSYLLTSSSSSFMSPTTFVSSVSSSEESLISTHGPTSSSSFSTTTTTSTTSSSSAGMSRFSLVYSLLVTQLLFWILWYFSSNVIQETSRRLYNLPYCLLVLASSLTVLFSLALGEVIFDLIRECRSYSKSPSCSGSSSSGSSKNINNSNSRNANSSSSSDSCSTSANKSHSDYSNLESLILSSISNNQLIVFLLANILTGIVNISIPTIDMSNYAAIGILIAYCFAVSLFAIFWNVYKAKY